jgi:hypothetical protein
MRWVPRLTRGIGLFGERHELLQVLRVDGGDGLVATLLTSDFPRVTGVEMSLATVELQQLPRFGDSDPLRDRFVCLHRVD